MHGIARIYLIIITTFNNVLVVVTQISAPVNGCVQGTTGCGWVCVFWLKDDLDIVPIPDLHQEN